MSHIITCNQVMYGHKSGRRPAHVGFDRGERPFWWAAGLVKKSPCYLEKRTKERTSNIFSPNYSVGTLLCTVKSPGSGMAWWVNAGAKPHLPHIVLLVDFLHSHASSRNMLSQGWRRVSFLRIPQLLVCGLSVSDLCLLSVVTKWVESKSHKSRPVSGFRAAVLLCSTAVGYPQCLCILNVTWQSISGHMHRWSCANRPPEAVKQQVMLHWNIVFCVKTVVNSGMSEWGVREQPFSFDAK